MYLATFAIFRSVNSIDKLRNRIFKTNFVIVAWHGTLMHSQDNKWVCYKQGWQQQLFNACKIFAKQASKFFNLTSSTENAMPYKSYRNFYITLLPHSMNKYSTIHINWNHFKSYQLMWKQYVSFVPVEVEVQNYWREPDHLLSLSIYY